LSDDTEEFDGELAGALVWWQWLGSRSR
jgi:hypothetical protein